MRELVVEVGGAPRIVPLLLAQYGAAEAVKVLVEAQHRARRPVGQEGRARLSEPEIALGALEPVHIAPVATRHRTKVVPPFLRPEPARNVAGVGLAPGLTRAPHPPELAFGREDGRAHGRRAPRL
eukprot:scaffold4802_cov112-Isochrysis_galbana.AAC.7